MALLDTLRATLSPPKPMTRDEAFRQLADIDAEVATKHPALVQAKLKATQRVEQAAAALAQANMALNAAQQALTTFNLSVDTRRGPLETVIETTVPKTLDRAIQTVLEQRSEIKTEWTNGTYRAGYAELPSVTPTCTNTRELDEQHRHLDAVLERLRALRTVNIHADQIPVEIESIITSEQKTHEINMKRIASDKAKEKTAAAKAAAAW